MALTSFVFGCSGAKEQDVLSNDVGGASTNSSSSGTSGTTSGGSTSGGSTSGGSTSGGSTSGGSTSGGSTSGGPTGDCTAEDGDSDQDHPIKFNGCVSGTLTVPGDEEDWATFEMPKNNGISVQFTGPVALTFYNEQGRPFSIQKLPNNEGQYFIQVQYDFVHDPLPGGDANPKNPLSAPWTVTLTFKN